MFLIVRENVDPTPFSEVTVISPPRTLESFLLIERPSPQPCLFSSLSSKIFVKTENRSYNLSLSIPTPVSITSIYMISLLMAIGFNVMPPTFVYFIALDKRLMIIYLSLF